jgi:hypothetical protein
MNSMSFSDMYYVELFNKEDRVTIARDRVLYANYTSLFLCATLYFSLNIYNSYYKIKHFLYVYTVRYVLLVFLSIKLFT